MERKKLWLTPIRLSSLTYNPRILHPITKVMKYVSVDIPIVSGRLSEGCEKMLSSNTLPFSANSWEGKPMRPFNAYLAIP